MTTNDDQGQGQGDSRERERQREVSTNTGAIQYFTALEREWYTDRGFEMPLTGWNRCEGRDGVVEYRLEMGVWNIYGDRDGREVPGYEA